MTTRDAEDEPTEPAEVRKRAVAWVLGSGVVAAGWIALVLVVLESAKNVMVPGLALPLVPFLIFVVELVTGRKFADLAARWDELEGWQRGLLGVVIVAIAGVIIVGGVAVTLALVLPEP